MKITEDFLIQEGFVDTGETHGYNKIWTKPLRETGGFFNFEMGEYPETNPNVGVLGIYYPEEEIHTVPEDLVKKEVWSEEDDERACNYTMTSESHLMNFAFYLDDQARFKRLIEDITYQR